VWVRLTRQSPRPFAALAAGVLLYLAFPPVGWWPLAPVAVAALTVLVRDVRLRASYGLALLFSLGFCVPLLRFVSFVGADGWLVLSAAEAALLALVGPATTAVLRLPGRWVWVAAVWVGQEALRGRQPFGGFPWGRLAFSQPDSPFTPLAAIGGAPLVTAAVAFAGALLAASAAAAIAAVATTRGRAVPAVASVRAVERSSRRPPIVALAAPLAVRMASVAAVTLVGLMVGLPTAAQHGTARVAAVQGNVPRTGGYAALGEKFQVTANHVAGTERLAADVRAGRVARPDLVLWPENSSDVDPFSDARAAALLDGAARAVGVPILVGAVLDGPGNRQVRNAGLVWDRGGWTGAMYVKQHPVPFAEYLPGRAVLEKLIHRFAVEMPNDFVKGDRPGVLRVGGTTTGDVICFEVAYDGLVREAVDGGAQLLVIQTNNASFGRRGESQQQLAMSRLRAVEHGRATVQVSTSGQSAIIMPDGTVLSQTGLYESGVLSAELPLRTGRTLADQAGVAPEGVTAGIAAVAIMAGLAVGRRRSARPEAGGTWEPADTADTAGTGEPTPDHDQERSGVDGHRVVVCVPTYNERDNLTETARRLRVANPTVDLLVIDDASPDGTGKIADQLAGEDDQIHVLHRAGKSGLGSAYVAGFSWALRHGYDVIVEMDADGSHQPEELPKLLAALPDADLVIGSRWVPGGEVRNWPRSRFLLSRGANAYVRGALGMPLRDATAGFRAYRAAVLRDRNLDHVASQGYCFQVDLAWRAWRSGFRVVEVPITFVERERGTSKMSRGIVAEALWRVTWWAVTSRRRGPRPGVVPPTAAASKAADTARAPQDVTATQAAGGEGMPSVRPAPTGSVPVAAPAPPAGPAVNGKASANGHRATTATDPDQTPTQPPQPRGETAPTASSGR
jgi:apolipoprotein N-acyltransferase